ncbi:MAG: ATP phosphoribosyltransferase regulatory subunit [Candidatus Heimdallarchaeota archaeon]|nr:ATP phosphoribosyltransferase regulatory subunit [Candidatus Heimdallarchaeota archaeon]
MFINNQTPKGTKDYSTEIVKLHKAIEEKLSRFFELWGYKEIKTPIIEFGSIFSQNLGNELAKKMFKFQDFDGEILTLRPEMTIPIVRNIVAQAIKSEQPYRISYFANVFRYNQSYLERTREFWQAGIELVDSPTIERDGEVLALLASSMEEIGIKDFQIDINYLNIFQELFARISLSEEEKQFLKNKITIRDKGYLEAYLKEKGLTLDEIKVILDLIDYQPISSVCRKIDTNELNCLGFKSYLLKLNQILDDYNLQDSIYFDITLTKEINYYAGLTFEVSIPNLGIIIGSGGRYDTLLSNFGRNDLGGIGFALEIDRCIQALTAAKSNFTLKKRASALILTSNRKMGIKLSKIMRSLKFITTLEMVEDFSIIDTFGGLECFDYVIFYDGTSLNEVKVLDVNTKSFDIVTFDALEKISGESN